VNKIREYRKKWKINLEFERKRNKEEQKEKEF
jgi:hypothetical protein